MNKIILVISYIVIESFPDNILFSFWRNRPFLLYLPSPLQKKKVYLWIFPLAKSPFFFVCFFSVYYFLKKVLSYWKTSSDPQLNWWSCRRFPLLASLWESHRNNWAGTGAQVGRSVVTALQTDTAEVSYETWVSDHLGFKGNRKSEKDNERDWH